MARQALEPIEIAVVGHTNAGKTSLLRTLTRRRHFGEVSPRPGTTRHVESVDLTLDARVAVRFFDTPGLEDSVALLDYLNALEGCATRPDRVRAFLQGPEAARAFEQEAKVLRQMLRVDAAFYVVDSREPVLPKHRAEMDILTSCGKPVMPVLNFVRHADSRDREWQSALSDVGLHALARFDAVAPFVGSESQLYGDLVTLLRNRQPQLAEIVRSLERERAERREAGHRVIASMLVDVTAMRRTIEREALADPARRERLVGEFRQEVLARARAGMEELLEVFAFHEDEADVAVMPWLDGRWEADLFNPEVLRQASIRLGAGATIGASVGVAADLALAGMSLGAGAALGAAVGGALSQGASHLGRTLANRMRGLVDLTVEDPVIQVLAAHMTGLLAALEQRGHAAPGKVLVDASQSGLPSDELARVLTTLQPARGHPEWPAAARRRHRDARRDEVVEDVAAALGDAERGRRD
jgi:GTPase SAR1 family protein